MSDQEDHRKETGGGFDGQVLQREVRLAPGPPGGVAPGAAAGPAAAPAAAGAASPRARPHHVGPHPPRLLAFPRAQRHRYFRLISILETMIVDLSCTRKLSGASPAHHLAVRPTKTLSGNSSFGRENGRSRVDDEDRHGRKCESLPEVERSRDPDRETIEVQESFPYIASLEIFSSATATVFQFCSPRYR
ncbi:hypothetical protein BT93_A2106 [Corymbia citriodora subsp. variegata]|nr:hypothetical protein BT93_A2106 [Corymbia citriodora subsp. variegata]